MFPANAAHNQLRVDRPANEFHGEGKADHEILPLCSGFAAPRQSCGPCVIPEHATKVSPNPLLGLLKEPAKMIPRICGILVDDGRRRYAGVSRFRLRLSARLS